MLDVVNKLPMIKTLISKMLKMIVLKYGWDHEHEPDAECIGEVHSDDNGDDKIICSNRTLLRFLK